MNFFFGEVNVPEIKKGKIFLETYRFGIPSSIEEMPKTANSSEFLRGCNSLFFESSRLNSSIQIFIEIFLLVQESSM